MKFVASNDTAEVLEPREQPFDLPSSSLQTQQTTILYSRFFPIDFIRCNKFYSPSSKSLIEGVTVIRNVPNNPARYGASEASGESVFDKGDFSGLAEVAWMATGRPMLSATAMSFVALPRLVFPTPEPIFSQPQMSRR